MSDVIAAIVLHDKDLSEDWVHQHLPAGSGIRIVDVGVLGVDEERLSQTTADVLVVACATQTDDSLSLVAWWSRDRPDIPVVVLSQTSVNGFVREAFEAGAEDLVVVAHGALPASLREIAFTLQKAVARRAIPSAHDTDQGELICVLGPKGGTGKTLTSCNLAVCLAAAGKSVALVDLDLQFGDAALSLGLTPTTTIYDLTIAGGTLDADKVDSYLLPHSSGVKVMLAPLRPDQAEVVTVAFLRDLYDVLRETFEYVVVDTPPGFTPEVIATIDAASSVCMLGMLDALSLKNARLGLETLDLMGYDPARVRIVLNRADSSVGITHNDVVTIIGRSPDVLVPSSREITRSVNAGTPIALAQKRSEAAKAFNALAALYTGGHQGGDATDKKAGRSLLGRRR